MAEQQKVAYELGRFSKPNSDFPHGQWCVYVKTPGAARERYRLALSLTEPRAKAEAKMNEWVRRRQRALFDESDQTIGVLMEMYFEDRLKDKKSVEKEQRLWRARMAPVFGEKKPEDINMPVMVAGEERTLAHLYAHIRQQAGMRRATIYHELNILRTGMNWASKKSLIPRVHVWLPRRSKPRNTRLTFDQLEKLLEECKFPHLRLFVIIAASTGARKSAILELTWDRVDFEKRQIDFRVDSDQDDILDSGGKKGRSMVDMGGPAFRELSIAKRWRTINHVIEYNGRPVKDVHKALKEAMKRAGIREKFFGAHAIRHSVATLMADQGIDIRRIQKLLGHEDFSTTDKIYASHSRGYLSEAVGVMDRALGAEPGWDQNDLDILENQPRQIENPGSLNQTPEQ